MARLFAVHACAGPLVLRRVYLEADQVALDGQDGQGDGSPDLNHITRRKIVDHWKTSMQHRQPVPPAGSHSTPTEAFTQTQEPETAAFKATLPKVPLALVPSVVMAAIHTTTMRASMTAYSTAVGPSSLTRKLTMV